MAKVKETVFLSGDPGFTFVKLDSEWPLTGWNSVVIDGDEMKIMLMSGRSEDSFCVKGHRNLVGKEVVFI